MKISLQIFLNYISTLTFDMFFELYYIKNVIVTAYFLEMGFKKINKKGGKLK